MTQGSHCVISSTQDWDLCFSGCLATHGPGRVRQEGQRTLQWWSWYIAQHTLVAHHHLSSSNGFGPLIASAVPVQRGRAPAGTSSASRPSPARFQVCLLSA